MPRLTDNAICIRDLDWSESSQVVVLLTKDHGKVRGLAKGSRRNSPSAIAKFSGGINLLSMGQAVFTTKATQLASVTEWDLQNDHYHLRTSLRAQWSAMLAADLVNSLLADEDPHPGVYDAMGKLLAELIAPDMASAALLRFQWRLLVDVGYKPELDRDVESGEPLPKAKAYSFDPKLGGLTIRNGVHDEHWRVRLNTVDLLRDLAQGADTSGVHADVFLRANRLLCTYCRAIIDKQLPTMDFILNDSPSSLSQIEVKR